MDRVFVCSCPEDRIPDGGRIYKETDGSMRKTHFLNLLVAQMLAESILSTQHSAWNTVTIHWMDCSCSGSLTREEIPLKGSRCWRELALISVPWCIFVEDSVALSEPLPCNTTRKSHCRGLRHVEGLGRWNSVCTGMSGGGWSRRQRRGGIPFWKRERNSTARILVLDSPWYSIFDRGKENWKIILWTNGPLFYIPHLPLLLPHPHGLLLSSVLPLYFLSQFTLFSDSSNHCNLNT